MQIEKLVELLMSDRSIKTVTYYESPKKTIRLTKKHRSDGYKSARYSTYALTIGAPNYLAVRFIKACQKAGEPFPVKKPQINFYPKKKPAGKK